MEYNTSMNRRELPHTIQPFSLRSLSEVAENSPTPLVDSYPDNVSLRRRHRWALQVTLPQTSITKQNSPSLKHTYTHKERERERWTDTAQTETERQGPDRERNRNEKVEKNIPQTTNIKACVHRGTSIFFPEFDQFTPTTNQKQKSPGCKRNQMTTLVADEQVC